MTFRRITSLLLTVVALLVAPTALGATASADQHWVAADQASIHPGVQMYTDGAQCTANFIFESATATYIGYAAHCAGLGTNTDTNGCATGSLPLGTPVEIDGATRPGTLAYSSWDTMADVGEDDDNTCRYNDFALVRIHDDDLGRVNPTVPHWGGPTGLDTDGLVTFDSVYSYGNSSLRFGLTLLSPKEGVSLGDGGDGWTHLTYTATPGIPGDSGSGLLGPDGAAAGVLSTVTIAPLTGSNNYSDLALALSYVNAHTNLGVSLALGTEAFQPGALPLGI